MLMPIACICSLENTLRLFICWKSDSGLKLTFESRFKTIISQYLIKWGNSLEVLMFLLPRLKKPQSFWTKFWNSGHSASALLSRLTADQSRKKQSWSWSAKNRQTLCPASVSRKKKPRRFNVKNDRPSIGSAFWLEVEGCLLSRLAQNSQRICHVCPHASVLYRQNHFGCLNSQFYPN